MSNKPPGVKIDGIRGSIPQGYLLGRVDAGHGPVQLISQAKAQSAGLIPASLPGPPTGAAGGDLSGTYPNPSVVALRGNAVAVTAPDALDVLAWSGTAWAPLDLATVAYTGNYTDLIGLPAIHNVPAGGTAGQALTKVDGTDYNLAWSTISGGSGGGAASIYDDGSNLYVALSDADGQLVLDGSGDPVFSLEVLPPSSLPVGSSSAFGALKVDNVTIQAVAGLIGSKFCGFYAALTADQAVTNNVATTVLYNTVTLDTLGAYNAATGIYTPTKAGNWLFLWGMRASVATAMSLCQGKLWKGAANLQLINAPQLSGFATLSTSIFAFTLTSMNGTTDSVHVEGLVQGTGGSDQFDGFGGVLNVFGGIYLGP